jgi:hypothetical protein
MGKQKQPFDPYIRRVRVERLTIFEVTESELTALEQGSPESIFLNLGIAVLSVAISFLISLLTTTIDNTRTFCVFVIICVVGFIAGVTFGILWWQSRKQLRNVGREIRGRIRPEGDEDNSGAAGQGAV